MRFIIHELPYERPRLAGRLRYLRDGAPMGAVESWRLTDAAEGFRFLRVDMDAREAPSGHSHLYHATLGPSGRLEQLKFRFWGQGHEVEGSVVCQGDEFISVRRVNGRVYEDVAHAGAFWFPTGGGLALLAEWAGETRGTRLALDLSDPARLLALAETLVTIEWGETEMEESDSAPLAVRPLRVAWANQQRVVWLDAERRPLRVWRDDGLTAVAERLVRYGN